MIVRQRLVTVCLILVLHHVLCAREPALLVPRNSEGSEVEGLALDPRYSWSLCAVWGRMGAKIAFKLSTARSTACTVAAVPVGSSMI